MGTFFFSGVGNKENKLSVRAQYIFADIYPFFIFCKSSKMDININYGFSG